MLYQKGRRALYAEFIKPVESGGCELARNRFGLIVVLPSTFDKLLPRNLKQMNQTHKQMCACHELLNAEWKVEAIMQYRSARLARFAYALCLSLTQDNEVISAAFQRKRDEYFVFGFRDNGQQKSVNRMKHTLP